MEWLSYKNVLENTFGLGCDQDINSSSSATQQETPSGSHASVADEPIAPTSQNLASVCPANAERELQSYAYRSSGLLDSWHSLAFFGNNKTGHPNNPIDDMRHGLKTQNDDSQTGMDDSEQREFPSVITNSSSEDSSFYCNSFTDEYESDIPYPSPAKDAALHKMEEGKDITSKRRIVMSRERFEELAAKNERHFRPFGHGKFWTCLSLFFAWTGVLCAVSSAHSVRFVRLQKPIQITPMYYPVERMGLLRTEICLNATAAGADACKVISIDSEDIRDNKFGMARLFLVLGTVFGVFFALILSTSVYWESINLRPVAVGFLISYFFQSLSMLFFDTEVCASNKCRVDHGCVLSILAALGWIATCIATSRMDTFKILAKRQRRRELRQQLRDEYKRDLERKTYAREPSTATETTFVSQQSNFSSSSSFELNGIEVEDHNGDLGLIESNYSKRCQTKDGFKRSDPPLTVVKNVGFDSTDLHEC